MAGIGFKLRQMVQEGGLTGLISGYLGSSVLAAGPWLISIATTGFLARLLHDWGQLSAILVITLGLSALAASPFQFPLTRYLSDRLYAGDTTQHVSACCTCWLLAIVPATLIFALWTGLAGLSQTPSWWLWSHCVGLFAVSLTIWMVLLFLGVVRAYMGLILAFLLGNLVSLFFAWRWSGHPLETAFNPLSGYLIGQLLVAGVLIWTLLKEFPWPRSFAWDARAVGSLQKYAKLTALGFLYYLGIWADKLLMALGPGSQSHGAFWLRTHPDYQNLAFLASLTCLPALSIFFLQTETDFFERYREFFLALKSGSPLGQIRQVKKRMLDSLKNSARSLVFIQGTISLVAVLLAPVWLLQQATPAQEATARWLLIGVFFQTLMFFAVVVLLYFEWYSQALHSVLIFALINSLGTPLSPVPGLAFCASAVLALGWALFQLLTLLPQVDRIVYQRQPLTLHWLQGDNSAPPPDGFVVLEVQGKTPAGAQGVYTLLKAKEAS